MKVNYLRCASQVRLVRSPPNRNLVLVIGAAGNVGRSAVFTAKQRDLMSAESLDTLMCSG